MITEELNCVDVLLLNREEKRRIVPLLGVMKKKLCSIIN